MRNLKYPWVLGRLSYDDGDGNENGTITLDVHYAFCIFLERNCTAATWKCLDNESRFHCSIKSNICLRKRIRAEGFTWKKKFLHKQWAKKKKFVRAENSPPSPLTFLMVRPLILRPHFKSVKNGIRSKRGLNMVFEKGLSYPSVLFFWKDRWSMCLKCSFNAKLSFKYRESLLKFYK